MQPGHPEIIINDDWSQYEAAAKYGWEAYWKQDEFTRALMSWQTQAAKLLQSMQDYDVAEARKLKT